MQSVVELQVPLIVDVHHAENWALGLNNSFLHIYVRVEG